MNAGIRAVSWTSAIVLVIISVFALGIKASQPAEAAIRQDVVVCATLPPELQDLLNLSCINVRVPVVTATVRVNVPGDTVTRFLPQPTRTIRLPGDTETVYRDRPVPGPTKTVTAEPRPQRSASPQPTSGPTSTSTNNPTATATVTKTVEAEPDDLVRTIETPGKVKTILKNVSLGLASIIGLLLILILAMSAGYGLGFKDNEQREARFMASLLRRKDKS